MARASRGSGGPFRFRVSDSLAVPLRGHLLRLRLVEGEPSMADLKAGRQLRLVPPGGSEERIVAIVDHGVASGRPTQQRLERTRELDIIIATDSANVDGRPVEIGWHATGPVGDAGG